MKELVIVYDNSCIPNYDITNIIGEKSFGEIVYKRKNIKDRYIERIKEELGNINFIILNDIYYLNKFQQRVERLSKKYNIVHLFSDYIPKKTDEFSDIIGKCKYFIRDAIITSDQEIAATVFTDIDNYILFLQNAFDLKNTRIAIQSISADVLETNAFLNLNNIANFLQYITGGFDARFFNTLNGDNYTVTKSSANKKKIKSEYMFYQLIPDEMKSWFVLPYNYIEDENTASYTMERLHMTDIAIRWVHGSISVAEFKKLLDKIFYFISSRRERTVSAEKYNNLVNEMYYKKLIMRMDELKKHKLYSCFEQYIKLSTKYNSIDEIVNQYVRLYKEVSKSNKFNYVEVIGHGDLCFSNMLYNKDTFTLKLIDTKGALVEEDIWTNPYYDIAKLSHSICGNYDFFNNGLYEINLNEDMQFQLNVDFKNTEYKKVFKEYLKQYGFDYKATRIYEASLFLSMLPLHMDNPQKVFAFLLNAINILEEIENG